MDEENKGNGDYTENRQNSNANNTEYENFQKLLKQVLSAPKEEVEKRRREEQQEKRAG